MSREENVKMELNVGPLHIHLHTGAEPSCYDWIIGPEYDLKGLPKGPSTEGLRIMYQLRDDKGLKLRLTGKSKHGNSVNFKDEDIVVVSSDPTILKVTEEVGDISVEPAGPLGTAQVQVTVPSVLMADGTPLKGLFDVEVVAGAAVSITFDSSETFDLPDISPAPAPG